MTPSWGIEPGPHWWEASAQPLHHPCSEWAQVYGHVQIVSYKEMIPLPERSHKKLESLVVLHCIKKPGRDLSKVAQIPYKCLQSGF